MICLQPAALHKRRKDGQRNYGRNWKGRNSTLWHRLEHTVSRRKVQMEWLVFEADLATFSSVSLLGRVGLLARMLHNLWPW